MSTPEQKMAKSEREFLAIIRIQNEEIKHLKEQLRQVAKKGRTYFNKYIDVGEAMMREARASVALDHDPECKGPCCTCPI